MRSIFGQPRMFRCTNFLDEVLKKVRKLVDTFLRLTILKFQALLKHFLNSILEKLLNKNKFWLLGAKKGVIFGARCKFFRKWLLEA